MEQDENDDSCKCECCDKPADYLSAIDLTSEIIMLVCEKCHDKLPDEGWTDNPDRYFIEWLLGVFY